MYVLIPDLYEYRATYSKKFLCDREPVSQISEVGVDAMFPYVTECLNLLDFTGRVFKFAVSNIPFTGGHLPVAAELDAVWRIYVDHLDLAAQSLALCKAGHDVERVAKNHAVRPVGLVMVKIDNVQFA